MAVNSNTVHSQSSQPTTQPPPQKGRAKVQALLALERNIQERWDRERAFECDSISVSAETKKYFANAAFPYMNCRLHLGHGFSYSRCEFAVSYHRLLGEQCLWPFGLHCTGMPIKACADKIAREMDMYGFPPRFPTNTTAVEEEDPVDPTRIVDKAKGKKSKLVAKTGTAKFQWQIMQQLGLQDDEIRKFADSMYWLEYFPAYTRQDLKLAGFKVDWRRTFITTDVNPYFDSFVRWQFVKLKQLGYIKFGKRYCIYSPVMQQPCMDHDRSAGETVGPQEYTLIKMKVAKPYPEVLKSLELQPLPVYLVAATLRPETMYGQTNCWMQPDIDYIVYSTTNIDHKNVEELFISTERSASNLSYQLRSSSAFGKVNILTTIGKNGVIFGRDVMGAKLESPNTLKLKHIYVLPMMNIKKDKGTGVVTSVPSDAPDDYAALQDLKRKPDLCQKYNINATTMLFDPIPIIDVPEYGELSAPTICEQLKIKSQNDRDKLQEAKERVYLKGFYEGRLLVGPHAGQKVQDVKKVIQREMISQNQALIYYEPEKQVISRSGEECVAALVDQWFLDYSDEKWKQQARRCLEKMETFSAETRNGLEHCLSWLHEWSCSRSFGLGTRLPWDEKYLIESLSDSTIYMAYYTFAHMLQGNAEGSVPGTLGLRPDALTDAVWDYILLGQNKHAAVESIPLEALDTMRNEFLAFYGFDLRCTGKDLINNHLSFTIFNHVAIWPDDEKKWPRAMFCNGHLMLNNEKMSKSTGNFITFYEALEKYSADGTRLALADAGDTIADANFEEATADASTLKLYNWLEWVKDLYFNLMPKLPQRRRRRAAAAASGDNNLYDDTNLLWIDRVLLNEINVQIGKAQHAFERMLFKDALKYGFFEMQNALTDYKEIIGGEQNMDAELAKHFVEVQTVLLAPICPHICEYIWSEVLRRPQSLMLSGRVWPESAAKVDENLQRERMYLCNTAHDMRVRLQEHLQPKGQKKQQQQQERNIERPTHATVWVARSEPAWRSAILNTINTMRTGAAALPDNKEVSQVLARLPELKKYMKRAMPFVVAVKEKYEKVGDEALRTSLTFDEKAVLEQNLSYLRTTLDVDYIMLKYTDEIAADDQSPLATIRDETCPGEPRIVFSTAEHIKVACLNRQPMNAMFTVHVPVHRGDGVAEILARLSKRLVLRHGGSASAGKLVRLFKFKDGEVGMRVIPVWGQLYDGLVELAVDGKFNYDDVDTRQLVYFVE